MTLFRTAAVLALTAAAAGMLGTNSSLAEQLMNGPGARMGQDYDPWKKEDKKVENAKEHLPRLETAKEAPKRAVAAKETSKQKESAKKVTSNRDTAASTRPKLPARQPIQDAVSAVENPGQWQM
jgi:hypothetical protein